MTNLLEETRTAIDNSGHTPELVEWIGSRDGRYRLTWAEFSKLAGVVYNSGFGGQEVATDLVVVFTDGRKMWRNEYHGSEWWEFDAPERIMWSGATEKPTKLVGGMWTTMKELNEETGRGA